MTQKLEMTIYLNTRQVAIFQNLFKSSLIFIWRYEAYSFIKLAQTILQSYFYILTMGSQPPKPKEPQKTLKETVNQYTKQINKMRRQFNRDCMKLQMNDKKMNKDLKKLCNGNNPMVNKKSLGQNILKNQGFIKKYKNLDAQLQNTLFELQSMSTMDQMSNVMAGMAKMMGSSNEKMKVQNFQKNMTTYTTEKERMQMMNEMIQDTMDVEDEIDDSDVNNLIAGMENQVKAKKQKMAADTYEDADEA